MDIRFVLFILIMNLSCSNLEFQASRSPAGALKNCVEIKNQLVASFKVTTLKHFKNFVALENAPSLSKFDLLQSSITKRLDLKKYVKEIVKDEEDLLSSSKMLSILDEAIKTKNTNLTGPHETLRFLETLKNLNYVNHEHILLTNPFVRHFNKGGVVHIYDSYRAIFIELFRSNVKFAISYSEVLAFLTYLSKMDFHGEILAAIVKQINPSSYDLRRAIIELSESIESNGKLEKHVEFSDLGVMLGLSFHGSKVLDYNFDKVRSGYVFTKALERAAKEGRSLSFVKNLAATDYAKRIKLTEKDVVFIYKKYKNRRIGDQSFLDDIANELVELHPESKYKKSFYRVDYYDKELRYSPVKDQCSYGACWSFSRVSKLEIDQFSRTGEMIEFSEEFSFLSFLRNQYLLKFKEDLSNFDSLEIEEGSFASSFDLLTKHFGLVPKNMFKFKKSVMTISSKRSLHGQLEKIFIKFKQEIFALGSHELNYRKSLVKKYREIVNDLFVDHYGEIPKFFEFNGKRYTPISFAQEYGNTGDSLEFQTLNKSYYSNYKNHFRSIEIAGEIFSEDIVENTSWVLKDLEEIEGTIIKSIDSGRAVSASFRWYEDVSKNLDGMPQRGNVNRRTGEMTSPVHVDDTDVNKHGHAVVIIGYEVDVFGRVIRLKILNSHGYNSGENGIYHMDINYFKNYLRGIYVDGKDGLGLYYKVSNRIYS